MCLFFSRYSKALEFSLTKILTGELNFFDIALINGKKITISPIPILFCIANIFILLLYNLYYIFFLYKFYL